MATDVAVQTLSLAATTPTARTADAAGNTFTPPPSGPVNIRIVNGSGGSITCTVDDPTTGTPEAATQFNPDAALVVPASGTRAFKIANPARFTDPTTGKITLAWSSATSVTFELTA